MAAKKAQSAKAVAQTTSIQLSGETLPRRTLEQALRVARVLHETYAEKSATWDEMAQAMEIGPKSPNTKYLLWAAEAYGLVSREKNTLTLAETGRKIVAPTYDAEDSEAKVKALLTPAVLSKFYSDYNGFPYLLRRICQMYWSRTIRFRANVFKRPSTYWLKTRDMLAFS